MAMMVSVLYPTEDGKRFDMDYYLGTHLPLVQDKFGAHGMMSVQVCKGVGGGAPGAPAPYFVIANMVFPDAATMGAALKEAGPAVMADIPNYTDVEPIVQISEIA